MPEYNIVFTALEETIYSVIIEAETPLEAFAKFERGDRENYNEVAFNGTIKEKDIYIEGEWIETDNNQVYGGNKLRRFEIPLKLRSYRKKLNMIPFDDSEERRDFGND